MNPFDFTGMPVILGTVMVPMMGLQMVNKIMESDELQEFLKEDEKFDVCILEIFATEALLVS